MRKSSYKLEQEYSMGEGLRSAVSGMAGKKHYDAVITAFLNGEEKKGLRMHTDGNILYSYDTAIAMKEADGTVIINNTKYSRTTQKQVAQLETQVKDRGIPRAYTGEKDFEYGFQDFQMDNKKPLHKMIRRDK